jgi:ribonuclease R
MAKKKADSGGLPSRDDLLSYIAENPGRVGKREIARAFGIHGGAERAALNHLLRTLKDEGVIGRTAGRRLQMADDLPAELLVEVIELDDDGEAVAEPVMWRGEGAPPKILLKPMHGRRTYAAPGIGQRAIVNLRKLPDGSYDGRVRRIMDKEAEQIVGLYRRTPHGDRIQPTDRRLAREYHAQIPPDILVEDGDLVLAEPLSAKRFGPVPARVVRRIGKWGDTDAISLVAIATHGIPTRFPDSVIAEAEQAEPVIEPGKRTDLRHLPLVTIDDSDARDHDDAVFAEPTDQHGAAWHAVVAIADVAHYVRPGSELDRHAFRRGNSCYFPDRVVPMLPERLSNDLCSLRPGEDRACMAVHLWIGGSGKLLRWKFVRGLMRSAARLTYNEVQAHADGQPSDKTASLAPDLFDHLYGAYRSLLHARVERGALDIDKPERKVKIGENGKIEEITLRQRHDSHKMIEELMIAANVASANQLAERNMPVMYRIHDQPTPEKAHGLREYLQSVGLSLRKTPQLRPGDFAQLLKTVAETDLKDAVNEAVLRSQSQAQYAPDNIGHFGLGLANYCHFTSPIRRYADVLVHRALIRTLHLGAGGLPPDADAGFDKMGVHLTATERRAMKAERDAMDRYLAEFLADRIGAQMPGRVVGVGRFGIFVRLDGIQADGLLPARRLPGGPFRHNEDRHELEGHGVVYRLGDPVEVKIVEADAVSASVGFDLVEGGVEQRGARGASRREPPQRHKGRGGPKQRKKR